VIAYSRKLTERRPKAMNPSENIDIPISSEGVTKFSGIRTSTAKYNLYPFFLSVLLDAIEIIFV
jgi:hypothetical protein